MAFWPSTTRIVGGSILRIERGPTPSPVFVQVFIMRELRARVAQVCGEPLGEFRGTKDLTLSARRYGEKGDGLKVSRSARDLFELEDSD